MDHNRQYFSRCQLCFRLGVLRKVLFQKTHWFKIILSNSIIEIELEEVSYHLLSNENSPLKANNFKDEAQSFHALWRSINKGLDMEIQSPTLLP